MPESVVSMACAESVDNGSSVPNSDGSKAPAPSANGPAGKLPVRSGNRINIDCTSTGSTPSPLARSSRVSKDEAVDTVSVPETHASAAPGEARSSVAPEPTAVSRTECPAAGPPTVRRRTRTRTSVRSYIVGMRHTASGVASYSTAVR